ncbi:DUF4873 domain-containing protein [Rhodococcus hoagii]|nr:DUF4873 domain-containing protein [Prescottella equi]
MWRGTCPRTDARSRRGRGARRHDLTITTSEGSGTARVSGLDLWGSHMVEGLTRHRFPS